jgi:hypothetical protein
MELSRRERARQRPVSRRQDPPVRAARKSTRHRCSSLAAGFQRAAVRDAQPCSAGSRRLTAPPLGCFSNENEECEPDEAEADERQQAEGGGQKEPVTTTSRRPSCHCGEDAADGDPADEAGRDPKGRRHSSGPPLQHESRNPTADHEGKRCPEQVVPHDSDLPAGAIPRHDRALRQSVRPGVRQVSAGIGSPRAWAVSTLAR